MKRVTLGSSVPSCMWNKQAVGLSFFFSFFSLVNFTKTFFLWTTDAKVRPLERNRTDGRGESGTLLWISELLGS